MERVGREQGVSVGGGSGVGLCNVGSSPLQIEAASSFVEQGVGAVENMANAASAHLGRRSSEHGIKHATLLQTKSAEVRDQISSRTGCRSTF